MPQANQCENLDYASQIDIVKPSFEEKAKFWMVVSQKEMRRLSSSLFHFEQAWALKSCVVVPQLSLTNTECSHQKMTEPCTPFLFALSPAWKITHIKRNVRQ